jgi:peptidoglycan hydrolase-like protein with peptidoglycan-binding domain
MSSFRASQALLLLCTLAITPTFASRTHRAPTSGHARVASSKKGKRSVSRVRGQRTIDSDRATEIQTVLIQKKYLTGSPSGQWDSQTQEAMRKYQSDNGWQTKLTPDSRALISLGLGPKQNEQKAIGSTSGAVQEGLTTQAQSSEPAAENTLASIHTISQ